MGSIIAIPNARNVTTLLCHKRFNEASLPVVLVLVVVVVVVAVAAAAAAAVSWSIMVFVKRWISYCEKNVDIALWGK